MELARDEAERLPLVSGQVVGDHDEDFQWDMHLATRYMTAKALPALRFETEEHHGL